MPAVIPLEIDTSQVAREEQARVRAAKKWHADVIKVGKAYDMVGRQSRNSLSGILDEIRSSEVVTKKFETSLDRVVEELKAIRKASEQWGKGLRGNKRDTKSAADKLALLAKKQEAANILMKRGDVSARAAGAAARAYGNDLGKLGKEGADLARDLDRAQKETLELTAAQRSAAKTSVRHGLAISDLAKKAALLVGAYFGIQSVFRAVRALALGSIDAFADLQDAVVSLRKVTDDLGDKGLARLVDRLEELSTGPIPIATENLIELAAVAGQLGIETEAGLANAATTGAKLAAATDLAGDVAIKGLARILAINRESIDEIDNAGAALTKLGNTSKATEAEILPIANEIARSTANFNLGASATLGFAAALAEMGAKAEGVGSALFDLFGALLKARETGEGLEDLALIAGVTTDELRDMAEGSIADAALQFLKGLGTLGERSSIGLEKVGLASKRTAKALLPMAVNADRVADRLRVSSKASEENTALNKEAAAAFSTLRSDGQRLTNQFRLLLADGIGPLSDPMSELLRDTADLIGAWRDFGEGLKEIPGITTLVSVGLKILSDRLTKPIKQLTLLPKLLAVLASVQLGKLASTLEAVAKFAPIGTGAPILAMASDLRELETGFLVLATAQVGAKDSQEDLLDVQSEAPQIAGAAGDATGGLTDLLGEQEERAKALAKALVDVASGQLKLRSVIPASAISPSFLPGGFQPGLQRLDPQGNPITGGSTFGSMKIIAQEAIEKTEQVKSAAAGIADLIGKIDSDIGDLIDKALDFVQVLGGFTSGVGGRPGAGRADGRDGAGAAIGALGSIGAAGRGGGGQGAQAGAVLATALPVIGAFVALFSAVKNIISERELKRFSGSVGFAVGPQGRFNERGFLTTTEVQNASENLQAQKILKSLADGLDSIRIAAGGFIQELPMIELRIRNDGKAVEASVAGVLIGIFDTADEAIAAVLAKQVKSGTFGGIGDTVAAVLSRATQNVDLDELRENLNFARLIDQAGMADAARLVEDLGIQFSIMREKLGEMLDVGSGFGPAFEKLIILRNEELEAIRANIEQGLGQFIPGFNSGISALIKMTEEAASFAAALDLETAARERELVAIQKAADDQEQRTKIGELPLGGVPGPAGGGIGGGGGGGIIQGGDEAGSSITGLSDDIIALGRSGESGSLGVTALGEAIGTPGSGLHETLTGTGELADDAANRVAEGMESVVEGADSFHDSMTDVEKDMILVAAALEDIPAAIDPALIEAAAKGAASGLGKSLISLTQEVLGAQVGAAELQKFAALDAQLALFQQIQAARELLAVEGLLVGATRALFEAVVADADKALAKLLAGGGLAGQRGGGRGRRQEARREAEAAAESFAEAMLGFRQELSATSAEQQAWNDRVEEFRDLAAEAGIGTQGVAEGLRLMADVDLLALGDAWETTAAQFRASDLEGAVRDIGQRRTAAIEDVKIREDLSPDAAREAKKNIRETTRREFEALGKAALKGLGGALSKLNETGKETVKTINFLVKNADKLGLSLGQIGRTVRDQVLGPLLALARSEAERVGDTAEAARIAARQGKIAIALKTAELILARQMLEAAGALSRSLGRLIDDTIARLSRPTATDPTRGPGTVPGGRTGTRSARSSASDLSAARRDIEGILEGFRRARLGPTASSAATLAQQLKDVSDKASRAGFDLSKVSDAFAVARAEFVKTALDAIGPAEALNASAAALDDVEERFVDVVAGLMIVGAGADALADAGDRLVLASDAIEENLKVGIRQEIEALRNLTAPSNKVVFDEAQARFEELAATALDESLTNAQRAEALEALADASQAFRTETIERFGAGPGTQPILDAILATLEQVEAADILVTTDRQILEAQAASLAEIELTTAAQPTAASSAASFSSLETSIATLGGGIIDADLLATLMENLNGTQLQVEATISDLVDVLGADIFADVVEAIGALPFADLVNSLDAAGLDFGGFVDQLSGIDLSDLDFGEIVAALGPAGPIVQQLGAENFAEIVAALQPIIAGTAGTEAALTNENSAMIDKLRTMKDALRVGGSIQAKMTKGLDFTGRNTGPGSVQGELRTMSSILSGLQTFHSGGIARSTGLALLRRDERVLSPADTVSFDAGQFLAPVAPAGGDSSDLVSEVRSLKAQVAEMARMIKSQGATRVDIANMEADQADAALRVARMNLGANQETAEHTEGEGDEAR
jgi:TP901 family phage tail tape measure protein